jgi:hypothetical protein
MAWRCSMVEGYVVREAGQKGRQRFAYCNDAGHTDVRLERCDATRGMCTTVADRLTVWKSDMPVMKGQ